MRKSSIGLLVVALIVGGISAHASGVLNTPSGGYLLCVNSKTKVITYPGKTNCPKGSNRLTIGASGKDGKTLWNGEKDPENTLGSPGDMFINSVTKTLFGPKKLDGTWPAGVSMVGTNGGSGAPGAPGASAVAITELSICGASGTSLCKVGVQGPGGGTIFFVDYNDIYPTFNYLEAAPVSCEGSSKTWSSDTSFSVAGASGWAARAVGRGQTNTTAIMAAVTATDIPDAPAAAYADGLTCGSKTDWFLGSLGEMKLMYDNLQGVGEFGFGLYWSSTERDGYYAWAEFFNQGYEPSGTKDATFYVRPVRAF